MRKPRVPNVSFSVRINLGADRLRRQLQRRLDCSAPVLMETALQALAAKLDDEKSGAETSAAA
jgi:hypothetical protein